MDPSFRQSKYKNESGAKQGRYFMNRLDYFEIHQYPSFKRHKILSFLGFCLSIHLFIQTPAVSDVLTFPYLLFCLYLSNLSLVSFIILHRQVCRFNSYFFYPKKWLRFFLSIRKDVDLDDFDSCATMSTRNSINPP